MLLFFRNFKRKRFLKKIKFRSLLFPPLIFCTKILIKFQKSIFCWTKTKQNFLIIYESSPVCLKTTSFCPFFCVKKNYVFAKLFLKSSTLTVAACIFQFFFSWKWIKLRLFHKELERGKKTMYFLLQSSLKYFQEEGRSQADLRWRKEIS